MDGRVRPPRECVKPLEIELIVTTGLIDSTWQPTTTEWGTLPLPGSASATAMRLAETLQWLNDAFDEADGGERDFPMAASTEACA
jgi:hypothetical protein